MTDLMPKFCPHCLADFSAGVEVKTSNPPKCGVCLLPLWWEDRYGKTPDKPWPSYAEVREARISTAIEAERPKVQADASQLAMRLREENTRLLLLLRDTVAPGLRRAHSALEDAIGLNPVKHSAASAMSRVLDFAWKARREVVALMQATSDKPTNRQPKGSP